MAEETKEYKVLEEVVIGEDTHAVGAVISLTSEQAEPLLSEGKVEDAPEEEEN